MSTSTHLLGLLRSIARVLTGSTYALLGFDALRAPGGRVDAAREHPGIARTDRRSIRVAPSRVAAGQ
jgi:hypothetical protein